DERIRDDLNERLTDADDIDASAITVEVSNGIATLAGTVEQRWMKHRAEDLAENCSGVRDVHNQIRVQSQSSSHDTQPGQGATGSTSRTSGASTGSASSSLGSSTTPSGSPSGSASGSSSGASAGAGSSGSSSTTRPGGSSGTGHG
ncbi:MAG: hypothetical protein JWL98_513, partial [Xanthomonadaceae bacterium]|nr:hypothetical protein [Xanthomonadaceae bacterium]